MNIFLKMAVRNVFKNWRHSFAAILSISTGFIAMGLSEGYLTDLRRQYEKNFTQRVMMGHLIIEKKGADEFGQEDSWKYTMGQPEQQFVEEYLKARPHLVESRVRHLGVSGMINNGRSNAVFAGFAADVEEGAHMRGTDWAWNAVAGIPLQMAGERSVLIGRGLGYTLDCSTPVKMEHVRPGGGYFPGKRPFECARKKIQLSATTESAQLNAVDVEIAGITDAGLKETNARWIVMPLPLAQQLFDTDKITMFTVLLKDRSEIRNFVTDIVKEAASKGIEIEAMPWEDHHLGELFRRSMQILGMFRNFITAVVVTIAGMSVLNTLLKVVSERTREIGTLRSLGFLRKHIITLFALEGAFLSLFASVVGLILTLGIATAVNFAGVMYKGGVASEPIPLRMQYLPGVYLTSAIFLCVISLFAAVIPARNAAKQSIPDSLGHV
jgi:putative ABC transport system permease protein